MSEIVTVLLVEDNDADIDLARALLEDSRLHVNLNVVKDGREALDYLNRVGKYESAPRPDLVLLDLNLPKLDGKGVLAIVKKDPSLRIIPIVVLTSSEAEADILRSYDLGANCYVAKPVGLSAFQTIVKSIEGFWLTVVKLPVARP